MQTSKTILAAALGLASNIASAQVTFSYGASVDGNGAPPIYKSQTTSEGPFTTGSPVVAASGRQTATVQATTDPTVGSFKSATSVSVAPGGTGAFAEAYARLDLIDKVTFSGPGPTTQVQVTLFWDTTVTGATALQGSASPATSSFLQTWSFATLALTHQSVNPGFDPHCAQVEGGETPCEPAFLNTTNTVDNHIFTQASINDGAVQLSGLGYGDVAPNGNGHFAGQRTLTMEVPTGQALQLEYTAYNMSRCFDVSSCSVTTDASHSDYVGLQLAPGVTFSSQQGYQYLGAPSPVPEPASALLFLAGAAALAARVHRKSAQ